MNLQFFVVHEANADFVTATELADRVLVEAVAWVDTELLVFQRTWHQFNPAGEQLTWKRLKHLANGGDRRPWFL